MRREKQTLNSHEFPGRSELDTGEREENLGLARQGAKEKSWRCGGGEEYSTD